MEQEINKQIEEIISGIDCLKDFICYKSGFHNLCRVRDIGLESFLECLERKPEECNFSFSLALLNLCECPLRIYVAKKLNK